jgi:hypothetical protein
MQCILHKIYFWKVFHMYYNLICTPMWTKIFILVKSGCYMCTTSAECKTVITAMLTVMSGMDPHMISGTRVGLVESRWLVLLFKSSLRNGLCTVIEVRFGSIEVCLDI